METGKAMATEKAKAEMTHDDRLRDLGESFLLIEATGEELATFLVEDIRFLFERIEHFKMSRRVWIEDACEQVANADFEPCDNFVCQALGHAPRPVYHETLRAATKRELGA